MRDRRSYGLTDGAQAKLPVNNLASTFAGWVRFELPVPSEPSCVRISHLEQEAQMKLWMIPILVVADLMWHSSTLSAQQINSFVTGGLSSDLNGSRVPAIGAGVIFDVARSWISVGGQVDLFVSIPYVAVRGGPLIQGNVVHTRAARLFVMSGLG
jgi:hypothetical protein